MNYYLSYKYIPYFTFNTLPWFISKFVINWCMGRFYISNLISLWQNIGSHYTLFLYLNIFLMLPLGDYVWIHFLKWLMFLYLVYLMSPSVSFLLKVVNKIIIVFWNNLTAKIAIWNLFHWFFRYLSSHLFCLFVCF